MWKHSISMQYVLQEEQGKGKRRKEAGINSPSGKQQNLKKSLPQGSQQRLQQLKKPTPGLLQWVRQQKAQKQQQQQPAQRAGGQGTTAAAPAASVDPLTQDTPPHQLKIVEHEGQILLQLAPVAQGNKQMKAYVVLATL